MMSATSRMTKIVVALLIAFTVEHSNAEAGADAWQWSAFGGYQTWSVLSELEPISGGAFDEGGWHLGGAAHRQFGRFERSELAPRSWGAPFVRFRANFMDLGDVDELGPSAGSLDGPILMFQLGMRWGRQSRQRDSSVSL